MSQLSHILEVSGNPITVLENIETQKDIKIEPGAVWTLPEGSKAYLLDLLKGGGVRLHLEYIEILYRALFDLAETPRAAYGSLQKELSGTALNIEFQSLVQKVVRKRVIRTPAYRRRCEMILKLAEQFLGYDISGIMPRVSWGPIISSDIIRQAQSEQLLVNAGIHSRRTAMDVLGVQNPQAEFDSWLEERKIIREQNIDLPTPSSRGGATSRVLESESLDDLSTLEQA
jgi:hypothetical protein